MSTHTGVCKNWSNGCSEVHVLSYMYIHVYEYNVQQCVYTKHVHACSDLVQYVTPQVHMHTCKIYTAPSLRREPSFPCKCHRLASSVCVAPNSHCSRQGMAWAGTRCFWRQCGQMRTAHNTDQGTCTYVHCTLIISVIWRIYVCNWNAPTYVHTVHTYILIAPYCTACSLILNTMPKAKSHDWYSAAMHNNTIHENNNYELCLET